MNALDPDISVGKAAFKAVGAGLGEFLGLLTPIPGIGQILGPILGGLAGEVLGGAAYELMLIRIQQQQGQEIIDAFMTALEVGTMAVNWLKGAGERFYEAMPKIKIPDLPGWAKRVDFTGLLQALPFWGQEVIEPNLGKILWAIPGAMKSAVFGTKKEKGEVQELELPSESDIDTSASKPYFKAAGGYYSKETRGYLGATEAEARQKLGLTSATLPSSPSQQQAFKQVYDIAARVGGANFPEIVAAQAMHETGYLANPDSVYFKTGKTNAFGQTINASEVGTNGIVDKIYFRNRYWAVYDSLESSVKHNIKLWHNVNTNSRNYNAFSTPLEGIASVAPAYSPNADRANIALGYTVDAYSKGMVRALKLGGYDPKGKKGQTSKITTTTTNPPGVRPVNPSTSPTEAQKKRIQELQKKIAEAEALLKVSGFASGPIANITKQNLATNKAELAKLSAMAMTPMIPQTTSPATVTPQAQTAGSALERAGQTTGAQKGNMISGFGVTSGYGQRWGKLHGGIDIGTPTGTYVGLSVPVEIVYAGNHGGYGNVIDAWAPSLGLQFRLAHLSRIMVSKGQVVAAGTALGLTGGGLNDPGRGSSTGPHLHFEVDNKKNGTTYGGLGDPSPYVQYIILSKNGPALGAQVTTPGSVTTQQNAGAISQFPSYDANGSNTIILPGQQQQQPVMMGGQSAGGIVLGGSTAAVVNSYYKKQLLGFLYKQG